MKAIILSAGLGSRLLPSTLTIPKCLLPVDGERPVIELQLWALAQCGIRQVTIMVGYGAEYVEHFLSMHPIPGIEVRTCYNPFFANTNTAVTCWLAIREMTEDFVLLNGDTVFDTEIVRRVLAAPDAPLTMAIDQKAHYDDDDMKVMLDEYGRLKAVSKTLSALLIDGESLGVLLFRKEGIAAFRAALDTAMRTPVALHSWYHDIINCMAPALVVNTVSIQGLWWREIDTPQDLADIRACFTRWGLDDTRLISPVGIVHRQQF
jgi:choline kinase